MKKTSFVFMVLLAIFASCKKTSEVYLRYVDVEHELVTVGATTASIKCEYHYGISDYDEFYFILKKAYLFYGESDTNLTSVEMNKEGDWWGSLSVELSGLKENTTYYYYYEFDNGFNTMRTVTNSFRTSLLSNTTTPTVATIITDVGINYAQAGGVVSFSGGATVTECGVCWSKTPNPTLNDGHNVAEVCTGLFSVTISGMEANTQYHIRAYATNEVGTSYGVDKSLTTYEEGNADWVDLGLPSGLLWATHNVGADAPEDYGDYFAWAETEPKDYYGWDNYKYCCYNYGYYSTGLTKYCTDSTYGWNGFVDNLTTLLPEDDAATVNWGIGSRMPTANEWSELINHCPSIWTTQNGVEGRLFTGSNGNSLFLPATGFSSDSSVGSRGDYWTSSLTITNPDDAYAGSISSNSCSVNNGGNRVIEHAIRPVRSSFWE